MLELYHNNISVCAQKVRVLLAEKEIPWTSHHLSFSRGEQLTPEYLKLNPRGLVPTIVHDGRVVIESTVIDEYLDEVFPDKPLKSADPWERSQMRIWSKICDEGLHTQCATISFSGAFAKQLAHGKTPEELEARLMKMPDPARRERQRAIIKDGFDAPFVKEHVRLFDNSIGEMEEALKRGPWLAGKTFSLADISLLPYLERMDRLGLEGMWGKRPKVADWFVRMKARPSFKAISDYDPIMDYDDRVKGKVDHWTKVKAILEG
ncbi:MAG: glutathione S-transferase family protein [Betaproteobacteria bacterium]|nr:glutathione S-transferase family protein [Betaproteobacteria bacterium]